MLELHQLTGSGRLCTRNVAGAPRGRSASPRPAERSARGVPAAWAVGNRRLTASAGPAEGARGQGGRRLRLRLRRPGGRELGPRRRAGACPGLEPAPGRPCGTAVAWPRVAAASGVVPRLFRCYLKKRVRSSWSSLLARWKGYRVEASLVQPK